MNKYFQESIKSGKKSAVCSSGGNAGLAAAYACSASNLPCTVIIPKSTPSFAVDNVKESFVLKTITRMIPAKFENFPKFALL